MWELEKKSEVSILYIIYWLAMMFVDKYWGILYIWFLIKLYIKWFFIKPCITQT